MPNRSDVCTFCSLVMEAVVMEEVAVMEVEITVRY